jgi:hypothetical protein
VAAWILVRAARCHRPGGQRILPGVVPSAPTPVHGRYTIITFTSDIRGAGTDANVSCMLMGDKANTPTFVLENSRNNFEKGQRDEFVMESVDVGAIKKLQIGHDNKGLGPAWHLDHVEVIHQVHLSACGGRNGTTCVDWEFMRTLRVCEGTGNALDSLRGLPQPHRLEGLWGLHAGLSP